MKNLWLILVLLVCVMSLFLAMNAHASCESVWKPGDRVYIAPGHVVKVVVEAEDVMSYVTRPKITTPLVGDSSGQKLDTALETSNGVHYCGDYLEVEDKDLD